MSPPVPETTPAVHRAQRINPVVKGICLGSLALMVILGGWHVSRPTVNVGRSWPNDSRVSIDSIEHGTWDALLRRYVNDRGSVDYTRWKATTADIEALDGYLNSLSHAEPGETAARAARLAYWINAYNAVTVRGILREYPTKSIQNHVGRVYGYNIWRDLLLRVGDGHYSLGQIEHDILRPMNEPRIHFAIVCASRGCPRLLTEAYMAERIDEQLESNSREFFADSTRFSYDTSQKELRVSPILKWYADDFGRTQIEQIRAVARYLPDETARELAESGRATIRYLKYDWNLNDLATLSNEPPLPPP